MKPQMDPKEDIEIGIHAMIELRRLLPEGGPKNLGAVQKEMDERISPEFEPFFLGNAALHLLAKCERCGRCCREEKTIAVSIDDCRKIARHLGLSQKRFMMDYTKPHELKTEIVGSARMLKKNAGEACPFYSASLPGCLIHLVKPQVCTAAYYLSKMNLLLCEKRQEIAAIPGCPADAKLRASIEEFSRLLEVDPQARKDLDRLFSSGKPEVESFLLFLRLKGMETYFGKDVGQMLARRLGLSKMPGDNEMMAAAWLYAVEHCELLHSEGRGLPRHCQNLNH
jgi:Fe-S-cluster containining protein